MTRQKARLATAGRDCATEMEPWRLAATELARLIRVGQASSREAVAWCLARLDAVNGKLNAQNRWQLVGYGRLRDRR